VSPLILGVCLLVFVAASLSLMAFTGRKRVQLVIMAVTTAALLAAAVASRFW
jgi:hypothetical protein